ncbi:MAG TPA: RidA family protein [Gaiellaceae bacterium]|nr:RidA family protein [Gaiellaceae bacterium]
MPARKVIRPEAAGPFSPGLVVDGWVYLAGQGGFDPETGELAEGMAAQTARTIENVSVLLAEAGCTLKDVVSCLVHITDADHFAELNRVYESYFEAPRPVRTTVVADLVVPGMLVEITVVARPG